MSFTTWQNNIPSNNLVTNSIVLNNEGQQSRQPLAEINLFSANNAASLNFRSFTSVSTILQSSAFENQSIYLGTQLNHIPRSTLASIATTIKNSIASTITTTNFNNSFVLPQLIFIVLENGDAHYVPKAFAANLTCTKTLLSETQRESNLER